MKIPVTRTLSYFTIILIGIFSALVWMYAGIEGISVKKAQTFEAAKFHRYQDPTPIDEIIIGAFYFVPKNKKERAVMFWRDTLEENLKKLVAFHAFQFQGRSRIMYEIYPEPVIGRQNNLAYDTDVTQHGNPEALRRIAKEIEGRVLDSKGDLYRPDFASRPEHAHRVLLILYEGVGASGSENIALLSRTFLTDAQYRDVGPTFLVHEFYHTLGIPDGYELPGAIPTSEDIMGLGRARPLDTTYLSRVTLRAMGL